MYMQDTDRNFTDFCLYVEQTNHVVVIKSAMHWGYIYFYFGQIKDIKSLLHHYVGLIKFNCVFILSAAHA